MTVALVASSTSGTTDAQGTSRTCPVPAGAASGHVAVLALEMWQSTATNPTITWPAGFTEIVNYVSTTDGFQKVKAARKVLSAADSGNYSMSWTGTHFNQAQCTLWSGVDNTTPLDVAVNTAQNSTGTAYPSNAVTTAAAGCGMLHIVANENTGTSTPPTGYTEQQEANYLKTNTKIAGSAGSESISGGSLSASTLKLGALIALRPASSGNTTSITPATETDTGVVPVRSRTASPAAATETDTGVVPVRTRTASITPAAELDVAVGPTQSRTTSITPAAEVDSAITPAHGGAGVVPAAETDVGLTPTRTRTASIVPATETDTAVTPARSRTATVATAAETDTGVAPTRQRLQTPSSAVEVDVAVGPVQSRTTSITPATETDAGVAPANANEIIYELALAAAVEPGPWRALTEPSPWQAWTETTRLRVEVEA